MVYLEFPEHFPYTVTFDDGRFSIMDNFEPYENELFSSHRIENIELSKLNTSSAKYFHIVDYYTTLLDLFNKYHYQIFLPSKNLFDLSDTSEYDDYRITVDIVRQAVKLFVVNDLKLCDKETFSAALQYFRQMFHHKRSYIDESIHHHFGRSSCSLLYDVELHDLILKEQEASGTNYETVLLGDHSSWNAGLSFTDLVNAIRIVSIYCLTFDGIYMYQLFRNTFYPFIASAISNRKGSMLKLTATQRFRRFSKNEFSASYKYGLVTFIFNHVKSELTVTEQENQNLLVASKVNRLPLNIKIDEQTATYILYYFPDFKNLLLILDYLKPYFNNEFFKAYNSLSFVYDSEFESFMQYVVGHIGSSCNLAWDYEIGLTRLLSNLSYTSYVSEVPVEYNIIEKIITQRGLMLDLVSFVVDGVTYVGVLDDKFIVFSIPIESSLLSQFLQDYTTDQQFKILFKLCLFLIIDS